MTAGLGLSASPKDFTPGLDKLDMTLDFFKKHNLTPGGQRIFQVYMQADGGFLMCIAAVCDPLSLTYPYC